VTRNAIVDVIRKRRPDHGRGGSSVIQRLSAQPEQSPAEEIEREYRRELFRRAAKEIQHEFETGTWEAFRTTMLERKPIPQVAEQLSKSIASVYAARSRVMQRLKQRVKELEQE
ncbi:sigma-70 family RNA polymerase sigma factor, partial [bacterium]|nr:sigma-70 family RNA polymerase sigma factor [bacterium]